MGPTLEYTVFVQQIDGLGTIHIQCYTANSVTHAKEMALETVSKEWQREIEDLHVLGVASGDVIVLEWTDVCDIIT